MSKFNAFRVINLNYNNNSNRVEDETFSFDGDSTLLSLHNGGGKTVLVQMMLAPFVHKRYRNTPDRPFESFFTTNKPTFLLVEWILDGGAGYVLTGMMVRKSQADSKEDTKEELDIINFIYEYQESNPYDIYQFPVIDYENRGKKLKGFHACRKLFEDIRNEMGPRFQAFDMSQSNQQKQYFLRLREYGIHSEEWESIIKKINLKESGLSDLFKDAKDEAGLVEKWFLPAIETKLNKEENRMKQFRTMLYKFILQYKENEVKIQRKASILEFKEDGIQIEERAAGSLELLNQVSLKEEQIACLRYCIEELLEEIKRKEDASREVLDEKKDELLQIQYEEASYEIYQLLDKEDSLIFHQNRIQDQEDELNEEYLKLEQSWKIQQCAQIYEDYKEEELSVLTLENQYEIMKKDEEERMPERINLGYSLHLAYSHMVEKLEEEIHHRQEELERLGEEELNLKEEEGAARAEELLLQEECGLRRSNIKQYQEVEGQFNQLYPIKLERNILGTYEEGTFELMERKQKDQLEVMKHDLLTASSKRQKCEEEREIIQRKIQDCSLSLGKLTVLKDNLQEKEEKYEKELETRLHYMKYLSLSEDKRYDQEYICFKFKEKINVLKETLKKIDREKEKIENELDKMRHGVVLEIPKDFEEFLHSLDIHYITGMDYLKHNGYSQEQNQELLSKMPLLPFSIMMSKRELNKLEKGKAEFYTSYPIPIVIKEQLSQFPERDRTMIYKENQLNFFVLFNEELLDEKELKNLLLEKEKQLEEVKDRQKKKEEEISYYESMSQEIAFQELNPDIYEAFQKEMEKCLLEKEEQEKHLIELRSDKAGNEERIETLGSQCQQLEKTKDNLVKMQDAIKDMKERYERYQKDCKKLEQLKVRLDEISGESELRRKRTDEIYQAISDKKLFVRELEQEYRNASDKKNKYSSYQEGVKIHKDLEDIESRYYAITEKMAEDSKLVEQQLEQARNRFTKCQDRLIELSGKYMIEEKQYKETHYSPFHEKELEQKLEKLKESLEEIKKEWNRIDKEIGILESKITDRRSELLTKLGKEELVPKEKLTDTAFQTREKLIHHFLEEEEKRLQSFAARRSGYEANISALSEFSDLSFEKEYDFFTELSDFGRTSLEELNRKELEEIHGRMIRDYRNLQEKLRNQKLKLERMVEELLREERYQEDFYHQPLELMRQLVEKPADLLKQLSVTLKSYETLLEKMEVDIAFIDREREKVTEMLLDYVLEIHKNLDKIDRNSTITVKERAIKMLRIQVPSWEDNKEIYSQRMEGFIEELLSLGLKCIEDNENLEEILGIRVTSRTLYDAVVGISTTIIKLYKIEAQREYPITWAQVSRNSGGEGFLSAFVVLASLLSYMRRDESDLFIEREEGKVLIMDNPFAQTNASHLLIPLMDIAKKCNTQLICLTGLGGESIYNRFDNIYVLNLVESGLDRGVQYLKGDHVKGDAKVYQMSSSRMEIEEGEQMELLF